VRFVTHLGVSDADIERAIQVTADTCHEMD